MAEPIQPTCKQTWMQTVVSFRLVQESSQVTIGYKGVTGASRAATEEAMPGKKERGQAPDLVSSLQHECVLGLDLLYAELETRN